MSLAFLLVLNNGIGKKKISGRSVAVRLWPEAGPSLGRMGSSVSNDFSAGAGRESQAVPAESWQRLVPPDVIPISLANSKGETCFCRLCNGSKRRESREGTVEI